MSKLSKNMKAALAKFDQTKQYELAEACGILKEVTYTKFDSSVELVANLGVDPRKANQMIRGVVSLPHGTGKVTRVLVLCTPDKEAEAKEAGADYVGLDEYIEKIKAGWTDVDVIICTPSVMAKVGIIGRILGPRGLMRTLRLEPLLWQLVTLLRKLRLVRSTSKLTRPVLFTPLSASLLSQLSRLLTTPRLLCLQS